MKKKQQGSVVAYVLMAIFLIGILIMSVTEGPKKNAATQQLDDMALGFSSDISLIETTSTDCVLVYPNAIDIDADGDKDTTDNPNPPFPRIYVTATGYADTGPIAQAVCPGSPPAPIPALTAATTSQLLISGQAGRGFKVLGDTATYTTTLVTDTTEGVYIEIKRATANALWTETISRLNARYSPCKAAVVTAAGACANGCFYYWLKRLPTSVIGPEPGPDPAQCTL